MSDDNVTQFTGTTVSDFPEQDELINRIMDLVDEYPDMSSAAVVGALEFVKAPIVTSTALKIMGIRIEGED